ncbi:hypothetical protein H0H93_006315, partial [Arthromyces matolae]
HDQKDLLRLVMERRHLDHEWITRRRFSLSEQRLYTAVSTILLPLLSPSWPSSPPPPLHTNA